MSPDAPSLAALDALPWREPRDYFHGIQADSLCRADNVICFLRRERAVLHERGFATRPHHRFVLILNFATSGTLNVDGNGFRLHPGEAFLIAPYQLHFYMDVAAPTIRWVYFTFEAPERDPFESFLNVPIRFDEAEAEAGRRLAESALRVELEGAAARESLVLGLSLLLTQLKHRAIRRGLGMFASAPEGDLVGRINRLLSWHLEEGLDVRALATRLSISESHLRRRFRALTGLSLGHYLLHYRLNRAIKLLVHSRSSLTAIAFACGYESLAAFSRGFKAKVGQTPSDFRRSGGRTDRR